MTPAPGRPKKFDRQPHSLMIDHDLWEVLSQQAEASKQSRSDLVNMALRSWLPRKKWERSEMAIRYYDRGGNQLADCLEWARLEDAGGIEYKIVEQTVIGEDVLVSTVWLGRDHQWKDGGPPLIFETMVFGGELGEYQERYSTEAEALTGHERMVTRVQRTVSD